MMLCVKRVLLMSHLSSWFSNADRRRWLLENICFINFSISRTIDTLLPAFVRACTHIDRVSIGVDNV